MRQPEVTDPVKSQIMYYYVTGQGGMPDGQKL